MAIVAVAIVLDSTGPVIYRQTRLGRMGRCFDVIKFRSMRVDAEENGAQWATENDPRLTRVGRFLRKYRLDELPQFLNVIRGEMSFVGPRPERPCFVEELRKQIPYYDERHSVRPGITGWAQVQYSYGASVEGEIEAITGVEDDIGSDEEANRESLPVALDFIRKTGIDVFAPAIGNAHGVYRSEPHLDAQRVSDIVAAEPIPIALHGGTGMTDAQFTDLISRGCAKVNISTALKITYMKSNLAFLLDARDRDTWDPPSLFTSVRGAVLEMAAGHMRRFGSVGQAW